MRRMGPGGTKLLKDESVCRLLALFSKTFAEGNSVRKIVQALKEDGRPLPESFIRRMGVDQPILGREELGPVTFATRWLQERMTALRTSVEVRGAADFGLVPSARSRKVRWRNGCWGDG